MPQVRSGSKPPQAARSEGPRGERRAESGSLGAIDLHCHVFALEVEAAIAGRPEARRMQEREARAVGARSTAHNRSLMPELAPKLLDVAQRLSEMDAMGVEIQVISPSPTQYHHWAEPELAASLADLQNAQIARICAEHPGRFVGLAAVSFQHPELAAEQLRGIMERGFRGAEISTRVGEVDVSDPRFEPFWLEAEQSQALLFIHPMFSTLGERLAAFYLANTIGQPLETTVALSHLIFGGVLDRHPGLKICAAHGGGFLPAYVGRFDHAYRVRPEAREIARPPSQYLERLYYDTVVHRPSVLQHLIEVVGIERIVLGTDYPFDMGAYENSELLDDLDLDAADRDAILRRNARQLLGL